MNFLRVEGISWSTSISSNTAWLLRNKGKGIKLLQLNILWICKVELLLYKNYQK